MDDELTDYGRVSGEQLTNWGEEGLKKDNVVLLDVKGDKCRIVLRLSIGCVAQKLHSTPVAALNLCHPSLPLRCATDKEMTKNVLSG